MFRFKNVAYQKDGVPSGTTTTPNGATVVATKAGTEDDLAKQLKDLQEAFEAEKAKREKDVASVKSAYQRQLNEREASFKKLQEEYQKTVDELTMRGLDEDGKKQYAQEVERRRSSESQQEAELLRQQIAELQQMTNYTEAFVSMGVKREDLITNQGIDLLVQSGWDAVNKTMKELREQVSNKPSPEADPKIPAPETPAPEVVVPGGGVASGLGLTELAEKYSGGNVDELFHLVETGQLPSSILPISE